MKQSGDLFESDESSSAPTLEEVKGKVRALVGALLDANAEAGHVSYALAYIATEFGLYDAPSAVRVFPVVLSAMARAAADHKVESDESKPANSDSNNTDDERPGGATLH